MSDHSKPVASEDEAEGGSDHSDEQDAADDDHDAGHDKIAQQRDASTADSSAKDPHAGHDHREPLPMNQREVTAVLVRTSTQKVAPGLHNLINEGQEAQAVMPVAEIFNLFEVIVQPIQTVLLVLTAMICIVSGVSILISIYNSMSERRHEIAVMRALGASRETVMSIILCESVFLALGGGAAGWLIAHLGSWLASPLIEARTGVTIRFWDIQLAEALLIPLLILLAITCGLFPAISAYRTDVAESLSD
jgi:putative ABC transport system permease protein